MKLAQLNDIFGKVTPPPGSEAFADPMAGLGKLMSTAIQIAILIAGILVLIYLMWGAFDWISSSGDKEKLSKAQNKIVNAIIGIILIIAALSLFGVITGDILGIIVKTPNGWQFKIPTMAP